MGAESDMAAEVFKDTSLFDFLGTADPRREREAERPLIDHVERFLLELGQGFAFVGRQKAAPFHPAFIGQRNLHLSAVDDLLWQPDDGPMIGLLFCKGKDRLVAEYAPRGLHKPIGVADCETQITASLPADLQSALPTVQQIEAESQRLETPRANPRRRKRGGRGMKTRPDRPHLSQTKSHRRRLRPGDRFCPSE